MGKAPHSDSNDKATSGFDGEFHEVLKLELEQIAASRKERINPVTTRFDEADDHGSLSTGDSETDEHDRVVESAADMRLFGLAFSGGGIRSATFNLGVLQALAKLKLLRHVDYLSTVSGGGYIGSWLQAWIAREAEKTRKQGDTVPPIHAIEKALGRVVESSRENSDAESVSFLRRYSNYLTPRVGMFSADTWSMVSMYFSNFFLNLVMLVTAMAAFLTLPWIVGAVQGNLVDGASDVAVQRWIAACLFFALIISFSDMNSIWHPQRSAADPPSFLRKIWRALTKPSGRTRIQWFVVVPIVVAAFLMASLLAMKEGTNDELVVGALGFNSDFSGIGSVPGSRLDYLTGLSFWCALIYAAPLLVVVLSHFVSRWKKGKDVKLREGVALVLSGLAAGYLGGLLLRCLADFRLEHRDLVTFGPPLVIGVYTIAAVIQIGLMGRHFDDDIREWWARVGGWLLIYTVGWLGHYSLAHYVGPLRVSSFETAGQTAAAIGTSTWFVAVLHVLRSGQRETDEKSRLSILAARVAPYLVLIGIVAAVSILLHWSLVAVNFASKQGYAMADGNLSMNGAGFGIFAVVLITVSVFLSWRIDINAFSMHGLYKNRLVRCYLGASNSDRKANPLTGFDRADDMKLADLGSRNSQESATTVPCGPYPLVNTAVNLVGGSNLASQQRKAASFVFTPNHFGYRDQREVVGKTETDLIDAYVETKDIEPPLTLGTAFAVSGAAASPNMGYHSTPVLAFLLTVFNVRLGYWLCNPGSQNLARQSSPKSGLWWMLQELFGTTNTESKYVYLSDGGHFENLGVYELIRRRCRFIVVVDAGQDGGFDFDDLGNLVRKCRTDLDVDIDIDVSSIREVDDQGLHGARFAVGHVDYGKREGSGLLVYVKPTLTGDEPGDIRNYASRHPTYPHESTADQWFAEAQFESYRRLGYHVAMDTFEPALAWMRAMHEMHMSASTDTEITAPADLDLETFFHAVRRMGIPQSASIREAFTRHTEQLDRIFERLRTSEDDLDFLDAQIYPEWMSVMAGSTPTLKRDLFVPTSARKRRSGFYFCNSLIQLMENVYVDLELEIEHDHPDNRGWMNLFRHWAWSGMFRATWAVCGSTYGIRFQNFCEYRLNLGRGEVKAVEPVAVRGKFDALRKAQEDHVLNFHEVKIVEDLFRTNKPTASDGRLEVVPLRLRVESPAADNRGDDDAKRNAIEFTFGFALIHKVGSARGEIVYFRVQDHLRRMGLARRGMKVLLRGEENTSFDKTATSHDAASLRRRVPEFDDDSIEIPVDRDRQRFDRLYRAVSGA